MTKAPHVLHLNIIRPVFVGFSVAIELQNRQYTIRSHGSFTDNLLRYIISHLELYIAPREYRQPVWLVRRSLCSCKIFAGRPANYKIAQMAHENMLCKMDAKKCANVLIE
ncbi:MAG: hypothetical protein WBP64_06195 [Nitrososphaeraceae archaeon]